jgi:methylglutaconyl-CoA hydratase
LVPGLTAPLLSYRVGVGNAAKLLFTGGPMTAANAQRIGIVHELVDEHLLWLQAHEMAKQCAANSIQSMQLTKQLLNETVAEELYTQLSIGAANMATARTTDAAQQGVDAFLNKMPVTFE